ncbi:hypothetical protein GJ744_010817 [Endocarpon pusillum]|uniref:Filamentation protein n=1 Tax=Endocarpon pusillum TaxID=364733 RepID=A0A8H7AGZ8_9EURO|nr:hypothetical protein GJ744_010817 [Endocarpon pusillum]
MLTHDSEKARRYIDLLDTARCGGLWDQVPELVRKVTKHAPQRTCLILTATTEHKVTKYITRVSGLTSSTARSQVPELAQLAPPLLYSIESQSHPNSDVLQCQTCVAQIYWLLSEPGSAVSRLPTDIAWMFSEILKVQSSPSNYTTLCMLKCVYMKALFLSQKGDISGSLEVSKSARLWLHEHESKLLSHPQLRAWSEQILAHMALTAVEGAHLSSGAHEQIDIALQAFRQWAISSARSKEPLRDDFGIVRPLRQKVEILKAYYLFLSELLQDGIDHHVLGEKHTRLHQVAELRRIESIYENELLRVTRFPKADESNQAIEEWVGHVIRNWEILCGRAWPELELGEGGRDAYGRNVLDILYRAATKTFHSTLILRHLFQVHKALADFSLAYKALDAYLELVDRGKARAQKSSEGLTGIGDEESIIRTIAEGIEGLCIFGRRDQAEKAFRLTGTLGEWIDDFTSRRSEAPTNQSPDLETGHGNAHHKMVEARVLEAAHRAIGIGRAFWALWTPFNERRSIHQNEALASFKQATRVLSDASPSLETAYALALLLAETRDLKSAIDCVKGALSTFSVQTEEHDFAEQRRTMPLWHLLALLLSARQDFNTAYEMCGAAFDQLTNADNLLDNLSTSVNGNLVSNSEKAPLNDESHDLIGDMDWTERERIIEIRITELAIIELTEGAEEAVNSSNELLSLFSKLFSHLGVGQEERPQPRRLIPPKNSTRTGKSLRGSIFGRRRERPTTTAQNEAANAVPFLPQNILARYPTQTTEAPTIKVTDEDSRTEKHKSHSIRRSHSHSRSDPQSHKLYKREGLKAGILRRHSRSAETRPVSSIVSGPCQSFETGQEQISRRASIIGDVPNGVSEDSPVDQLGAISTAEIIAADATPLHSHNKVPEAKVSLPPIGHNIDHRELPPPPGHERQPPQQDVRLPIVHSLTTSTQPTPRFSRTAEQIHAHGILVKVWLLVAGLYRRATLFDDSLEACGEAARSASQVEALVAAQESSITTFTEPAWEGGKSSNEIWADVHAERAHLALAKAMPHEAVKHFEEALMCSLDHPKATVGLSNILLDIYEQKIPSEPPRPGLDLDVSEKEQQSHAKAATIQNGPLNEKTQGAHRAGDELRKTPENLNRLAARDRAYGLLCNLTKLGSSWDDSEAWYTLARAHECSGQIEKAKEVLWWCVELEDKRPVRHWRNIGPGSYVL